MVEPGEDLPLGLGADEQGRVAGDVTLNEATIAGLAFEQFVGSLVLRSTQKAQGTAFEWSLRVRCERDRER
jgi:hypothetical protein